MRARLEFVPTIAGYDFSDAGPLPRNVDAAVSDLHAMASAAHLAEPMILVGHSLGSNIFQRYAQRFPSAVSGLVLIDPPPQHIAEFSDDWVKTDDAMRAAGLAFYRACEKGAQKGQLDAPPPALKSCLRGPEPAYSEALNAAIHRNKSRPAFWQTVISGTEANGALFAQPVSATEKYGALPLIVLTADAAYADAPPADPKILQAAQNATHERIVATSTRGERIHVAGALHEVQRDHPDLVAASVDKMIKQGDSAQAATRSLR